MERIHDGNKWVDSDNFFGTDGKSPFADVNRPGAPQRLRDMREITKACPAASSRMAALRRSLERILALEEVRRTSAEAVVARLQDLLVELKDLPPSDSSAGQCLDPPPTERSDPPTPGPSSKR